MALLGLASLGSALLVSRDTESLLSAFRFSITLSLAFFVVWLCRDSRDLRFVLRATAAGIIVGLGISAVVGPAGSVLDERSGFGLLGPNILGLASAFLALLGMTHAVSSRWSVRLLLVASGATGLFLAKSVGSVVALVVSMAILYGLKNRGIRLGRVLALLALLLGIAVVAVGAFRPTSLPWHQDFGTGSAQQRLITGYAGFRVFLENPLVGVGWANSPEAIASPDIAAVLRAQLPTRNALLYPDVQPSGVHNAYVQLLAELGLLGVMVTAWLVWTFIRMGRDLIRSDHPAAPFVLGSLMLFVVWWNETSLFGGQPETFLFALTAGTTAMVHAQARGKGPKQRSLGSPTHISPPEGRRTGPLGTVRP